MTTLELIRTHPAMQECPHCGTKHPPVSVERDALEVTMYEVDPSIPDGIAETDSETSNLDNTEYYYRCCSEPVPDRSLCDLLDEATYGGVFIADPTHELGAEPIDIRQ